MSKTVRDPISIRTLPDVIRRLIPCQQVLVTSTVPRGGLQLCQPARLPAAFVDAYAEGGHCEDRLSWHAIIKKRPVNSAEMAVKEVSATSPYAAHLMEPLDIVSAIAFPIAAPIFAGYPGSLHLLRSRKQGAFTPSQIAAVSAAVKSFEQRQAAHRTSRQAQGNGVWIAASKQPAGIVVLDGKLRVLHAGDVWQQAPSRLREHALDYARRRFAQLSNRGFSAGHSQFADEHGNVTVFRVVAFRKYPAIGDGPVGFICIQPSSPEWLTLRGGDFAADWELARLIPSLRYMQKTFRDGPTLANIAKSADLSAFHYHRRFSELLGMTPKQFLLDCQIYQAKRAIIEGKADLADIAMGCGFSHQSHFTSRFRQVTGYTPTHWRRVARSRGKRS